MSAETPTCDLPCPDPGHGEPSRIGNRRSSCRTCNSFARRLERAVTAALRHRQPETYRAVRAEEERALYAALVKGQTP